MELAIVSWDDNNINDGVLYEAYFPEGTVLLAAEGKPALVERTHFSPVYTYTGRSERLLPIKIKLLDTINQQIDIIKRWFDPFDDTGLKTLVVKDSAGWDRQWSVEAKAFSVASIDGQVVTINLLVPDPIWQARLQTTDTWSLTATGQTNVVTAGGNQDAYPVYSLVPTDAKSGGTVRYRNFSTVYNQTARTFSNYPLDLGEDAWDTDALVTAAKMQSDGSDIHVFVDGAEVDYWLDGINTTTTKLWININLQPQVALTVDGAHSNSVETIDLENTSGNKEAIARLPNTGIMLTPNNELIYFTAKSEGALTLTAKRGTFDSTAGTIADTNTLFWVEHDIYIVYGDTSLTDIIVDDARKPMIETATSTNISWDWNEFVVFNNNSNATNRSARWAYTEALNLGTAEAAWLYYTSMNSLSPASQEDHTNQTAAVTGIHTFVNDASSSLFINWAINIPAGITDIISDGDKFRAAGSTFWFDIAEFQESTDGISWTQIFAITDPSSTAVIESWSQGSTALGATSPFVRLFVSGDNTTESDVEADNVTLALDSSGIPFVAFVGEAQPYLFDVTLTNTDTLDELLISYAVPIDDTLEIDTDNRTITHIEWGVKATEAVRESTIRWDIFRLQFGGNILQYDETGVVGVDLITLWRDRNN